MIKRAVVLTALLASLCGCNKLGCALLSYDGCPGTGAYDMCRDKEYRKAHPDYCATPRPTPNIGRQSLLHGSE